MVAKMDICFVCKKKIISDAFRCPEHRRFLHTECMKKHVLKCPTFHRRVKWRKKE